MSLRPYVHITCAHLADLRARLTRIKVECSDNPHASELARQSLELLDNALDALDMDNNKPLRRF